MLPDIKTDIPGPHSRALIDDLARFECPAITARRARRAEETGVGQDPIVWERAEAANIWDADGNRFVDLCGAFAVAGVGHCHPKVVAAGQRQAAQLIHAMGDVFPSRLKIDLCRKLAEITPGDLQHTILAQSGASAVEAALKTAVMATGKPGVIAFQGAYHGLSYGALAVTAYRREFRAPFMAQLNPHVIHAPYPGPESPLGEDAQASLRWLRHLLEDPASGATRIGAVIFEPIQGRGGEVTPPVSWVQGLRELCDEFELVLIADEIYTGFGRTGRWFACEHFGIVPDVMCVGKGMGGGFPISAAIGRPHIMEAWGASRGESIHTSTFLGNPLGCAMALATIEALETDRLIDRCALLGDHLRKALEGLRLSHRSLGPVRGMGLMLGLPIQDAEGHPMGAEAIQIVSDLLASGFILLPSGVHGHVLGFAPPFVITKNQLDAGVDALDAALRARLGA